MTPVECVFEEEVLAAAMQSRWPDRVDPELRTHVDSCSICRDLAEVAGAISDAKDEMRATVPVPDSGRVWWTAQLRARREALQAASRPITAAHVIAFACVAGLAGACFGATSAWFQSALRWLGKGASFAPSVAAMVAEHAALVAGMAVLLFLVPAAVYLAMGRD
jgi:hypothetical protein